jgi:hypothetical protein
MTEGSEVEGLFRALDAATERVRAARRAGNDGELHAALVAWDEAIAPLVRIVRDRIEPT